MLSVPQLLISFLFLSSVKTDAFFLTTDYLQNAYYINDQNSFQKTDSTGKILFTYNQIRYGKLRFADATNPLKLILSYPDYGTVVMLDNTLSEIGVMNLRSAGILSYSAVCFSSRDNNIWVFDEQDYTLKKIDNNLNIILQSSDMFSLVGMAVHPVFMKEQDQFLYLSDPAIGILVFDVYGIYYQTLPFRNIDKFQVRNNQLFFRVGNSLHSYHLKTLEEQNIALPDSSELLDVRIEQNRLYELRSGTLDIYSY
jgi:hypothetical protein